MITFRTDNSTYTRVFLGGKWFSKMSLNFRNFVYQKWKLILSHGSRCMLNMALYICMYLTIIANSQVKILIKIICYKNICTLVHTIHSITYRACIIQFAFCFFTNIHNKWIVCVCVPIKYVTITSNTSKPRQATRLLLLFLLLL